MDKQDRQRLKTLLFNLLYPAVLGTLFVSLLPATAASFRGGGSIKVVVCWLIVAHFIVDYVFTEEVQEYRSLTFFLDFLVVVMLYVAFTAVQLDESGAIEVRTISFAMAIVYASFLGWEYLSRHEIGSHLVLTIYESVAAIWFLVAGLAWPSNVWVLLFGLITATVAMVIVCGSVIRAYHRGNASSHLEGSEQ